MRTVLALTAALLAGEASAQSKPDAWFTFDEATKKCFPLNKATPTPERLRASFAKQGHPGRLETAANGSVALLPESNSGRAAFEPVYLVRNRAGCQ